MKPGKSSKFSARRWKDYAGAYAFLLPNIIGFLAFTFGPVIVSLLLSFCNWNMITGVDGISWAGLDNYKRLATDHEFWSYLYNTVFLMLVIPFSMMGSLLVAILLNQKLRGSTLFRTVFFLPSMCVPIAVFLLWRWLLETDAGMVNMALASIGIRGPDWLHQPFWARTAVMMALFWMSLGGANMILYLAGLQGVSRELSEAAQIDGANPVQRFFAVTWPSLHPTTFFIFLTSLIGAFQGNFEGPYMMTKGGPAGSTTTLIYYIYNNAFDYFKMGYAAAIAWVLFIIILVVTLLNWRLLEGRIGYH